MSLTYAGFELFEATLPLHLKLRVNKTICRSIIFTIQSESCLLGTLVRYARYIYLKGWIVSWHCYDFSGVNCLTKVLPWNMLTIKARRTALHS